jgi:hypothetical protein
MAPLRETVGEKGAWMARAGPRGLLPSLIGPPRGVAGKDGARQRRAALDRTAHKRCRQEQEAREAVKAVVGKLVTLGCCSAYTGCCCAPARCRAASLSRGRSWRSWYSRRAVPSA